MDLLTSQSWAARAMVSSSSLMGIRLVRVVFVLVQVVRCTGRMGGVHGCAMFTV